MSDEAQGGPAESRLLDGEPLPSWFGILKKFVRRVTRNDMESIRQSIAAGITEERIPK